MSDVNLKLVIAISRSYNSVFSKIEKNVIQSGLNLSEFGVLEMLYHKGEQPVQKIAEKILVTSGTITYVIDKLQKKDLVYRKKCPKDGRIYYVCLTEKGTAFITELFPKHQRFLDELFDDLTQEVKEEVVKHLFSLVNTLSLQEEMEMNAGVNKSHCFGGRDAD